MSNVNIEQRQHYATAASSLASKGNYHPNVNQAHALRAQPYIQGGPAMIGDGMGALAHGFGGMSLQPPSAFTGSNRNISGASTASSDYGSVALNAGHPVYMHHHHHQQQNLVYPAAHMLQGTQHSHGLAPASGIYSSPAAQFVPQGSYPNYNAHMGAENSPHGQGAVWTPRVVSGDLPTLVTPRRDSVSSNENDLPGTPYTAYGNYNNHGVAVLDRSPSAGYAHSGTPSPSQLVAPYIIPQLAKVQGQPAVNTPLEIQMLVAREPAIPRAIPAPSSPAKPLDRSLENKNGETNVYIRGLLPETTDEMLHNWGIRFGDIQSSKSIIDLKSNLCKGFGFIKYHNFEEAERCIRGFHYLGYEVSFARESFYAKLKKFSDDANTNLYVSNIPRNMNEHELSAVFTPHEVCSARILRDASGNGRGVGFARFKSREVCEQIIKEFNNTPVSKPGGDEHIIQIRYSDTHEQKMLKQQTAAARQFRAAEFEYGVSVARSGGLLTAPAPERLTSLTPSEHDAANEFESFMANTMANRCYGQNRFAQPSFPAFRFGPASPMNPFGGVPRSNGYQPSPQVNIPTVGKPEDNDQATIKAENDTCPATPASTTGDSPSANQGANAKE